MAITNQDSLLRFQQMNDRLRASANRLNPFFGQQQQSSSFSVPTGGFLGQNQIGGSSSVNTYRAPKPELTPEELEEEELQERAMQYQKGVAEFNLGQKEADLEKRRAEAEEIASGRNILNGQAVTRAEMDQYLQGVKESGAKAQADFDRENPFFAATIKSMEPAPTRRKDMFGRFSESEKDYSDRLEEYLSPANKQAREQEFNRKLNTARRNALTNSINQFRSNPMGYLLGNGKNSSTYSPDALMNYLGQANQLFKATGQEGDFMDFILGNSSTGQGNVPRQASRNRANVQAFNARDLAEREAAKQRARGQQVIGFSSPQELAGEKSRRLAAQYEAYREDQREIGKFERDLKKQKGSNDYTYRNLSQAEREDNNFNSTARIKARLDTRKEIEEDLEEFKSRYD